MRSAVDHRAGRRRRAAVALLRRGDLTVTEVCMEVGCTSLGSFSARFTELMGVTPSEYRARSHEETRGIPACVAKQATRPTRRPSGRSGSEMPSEVARA